MSGCKTGCRTLVDAHPWISRNRRRIDQDGPQPPLVSSGCSAIALEVAVHSKPVDERGPHSGHGLVAPGSRRDQEEGGTALLTRFGHTFEEQHSSRVGERV